MFWKEGVVHIWLGIDHVLFLVTMLVGVIARSSVGVHPSSDAGRIVWSVVKLVTAFTIAHSMTLVVASMGWVSLPSRLVESVIAATVLLVAADNLHPFLPGSRSTIAFVPGLIHGFGFASVLAGLELRGEHLVRALLGFNLGVETGQLAIVLVVSPLLFVLRSRQFCHRIVFPLCSASVAGVALIWLAERAFGLRILAL